MQLFQVVVGPANTHVGVWQLQGAISRLDLLVAQLDRLLVVDACSDKAVGHSDGVVSVVLVALGLLLVDEHGLDEEVVGGDVVVVHQEVVFSVLVLFLDYEVETAIFVQIDESDQICVSPCQVHNLLVVL